MKSISIWFSMKTPRLSLNTMNQFKFSSSSTNVTEKLHPNRNFHSNKYNGIQLLLFPTIMTNTSLLSKNNLRSFLQIRSFSIETTKARIIQIQNVPNLNSITITKENLSKVYLVRLFTIFLFFILLFWFRKKKKKMVLRLKLTNLFTFIPFVF